MTRAEDAVALAQHFGITGRVEYDNSGNAVHVRSDAEQDMFCQAMRQHRANPLIANHNPPLWQAIKHGAKLIATSFCRGIGYSAAARLIRGR